MASPLRKGGGGDFPTLPPGTYTGQLLAVEVKAGKKYQSEELEDQIRFRFVVSHDSLGDVNLFKWTRNVAHPESGLVKLLLSMSGGALSADVIDDADRLWDFALSLQGHSFLLLVSKKDNGKNKITTVMALPNSTPPTGKPKGAAVLQDFTDDDIPF